MASEDWIRWGSPVPGVRPFGGPTGAGIFLSNGDDSYGSGAVTREAFALSGGVTIEAWMRGTFTGNHWEEALFGFLSDAPADSVIEPQWPFPRGIILVVNGRAGSVECHKGCGLPGALLPIPEPADEWHRYAIQVDPGPPGAEPDVTLLIDDQVVWRGTSPAFSTTDVVHGRVGGNMFFSVVEHGPVNIYRGTRYAPNGETMMRTAGEVDSVVLGGSAGGGGGSTSPPVLPERDPSQIPPPAPAKPLGRGRP